MATVTKKDAPVGHWRVNWWLLATMTLVVLAYRPVLQLFFVGDDFVVLHLVRQADGLRDVAAHFRLNFFGYYRPIAFLSQALDWQIWHEQPIGFHLTSLLLHTLNTALVFALARRLLGNLEAIVAALLFALHPSNHEAVFWMSARFDLLATCFVLAGLLAITRQLATIRQQFAADGGSWSASRHPWLQAAAVACFALALLSKESALAFPLIAVACDTFLARRSGRATLLRLLPLVGVVAVYGAIRMAAGGQELGEGMARTAKALLLGGGLAAIVGLAFRGADRSLEQLVAWRGRLAAAFAAVMAALIVAAILPGPGALVRPKLAFASFAGFYLLSPVITLGGSAPPTFDPNAAIYWVAGWAVLAGAGVLLLIVWQRGPGRTGAGQAENATVAFLFVFIAASLLPVSSMTEGKRYLYMASIGVALLVAYGVGRLRSASKPAALVGIAVVLVVSGWQIQLKAQDWTWAGEMTRATIGLVRASAPDPCRARNIVLLTAPVNIRDVYCHFYDLTFEDPVTRCAPQLVRTIIRVVGRDVGTTAAWTGPGTIVFTTTGATDRLIASRDLRHFDVPLPPAASLRLALPFGTLDISPAAGGRRFELRLSDEFDPGRWRFLYYGSGGVRDLPAPQWMRTGQR